MADNLLGPSRDGLGDPLALRRTPEYNKRLLIERPYIYAALHNQGASIVLHGAAATTDAVSNYSSVIGNDYHLDLIELDTVLKEDFSKEERDALESWSSGMSSSQAAYYQDIKPTSIRKRRQRALEKLTERLKDG